jgi:hypothetical protein
MWVGKILQCLNKLDILNEIIFYYLAPKCLKDQGVNSYCKFDSPSFPILSHLLFVNTSGCRNGKDVLHGLQKLALENLDRNQYLNHIIKT